MRELLALLSRLRISRAEGLNLDRAAKRQYLFPIIGSFLGALIAVVVFSLFQILGGHLNSLGIGLLGVIFIYFLTGLIHLEGLADFGDGLMASGDPDRKRGAMRDVRLGASGVFFMIVVVLFLVILIGSLSGSAPAPQFWLWGGEIPLVFGLILAETSAKMSMITVMYVGPSSHEGMGRSFVEAADNRTLLIGLIASVVISFALTGVMFPIVLLGPATAIAITFISRRHFGGVGGDAFGAANELGRLIVLFAWVVLL